MLTAAELTSMRATAATALPETGTVQRATRTADGMGGFSEVRATVATVACRVAPMGNQPQEETIAARLQGLVLWRVIVPRGTDVRNDDQIAVSWAAPAGTRTFEVVGTLKHSWESVLVCICTEVG